MTLRSPKQQQPKSSTISRRLRTRADQNLSVQPPQLSHVKALRSRRATTLPSPRRISGRISVNYQTDQSHTQGWDPALALDPFTRSNTSHPSGLEQNAPSGLLLSQPLDFPPYHSPQSSPTDLDPLSTQSEPQNFEAQQNSSSQFLPSPLPSLSGHHPVLDYELRLSAEPELPRDSSVQLQDMSTLSFMMPAHYGSMGHYGSPPTVDPPSYPSMSHHSYSESRASPQQPVTSAGYAPSYSSSTRQSPKPRLSGEHPVLPPYQHSPAARSPYQQPLESMRASPTPMSYPPTSGEGSITSTPHSYSYPSVHAGQGMSSLASNSSSYPPPPLYPPTTYEMGYSLPPTMYPPATTAGAYSSYESSNGLALAPPNGASPAGLPSSPSNQGNGVMPRVLNSRPKPQCWEHGCNGRQFSTFSNLLRHQREKSGTAAKSYCPRCGAEFTRTTARNGHMAHEKCKPRRTSDTSR